MLTPKIKADVRGPELVIERMREVQPRIPAPDANTKPY